MSAAEAKQTMKIVIVGHVDHGKSTLVGRMFNDTGSLPDGRVDEIRAMCVKRGMPFEWAFLMDALQAERDQGITIDTSQIWFKTDKRNYVIIDAPGHKEFLKNMVTGAASADAALLVIDANEGVREQSRRHGYLLHLMGVKQVAVAVNKMDMVGYGEARFQAIEREYREYLASIGVTPTFVIPVSAREGDFVVNRTGAMSWYEGPTVVEALDAFLPSRPPTQLPLRFPVQGVYKFDERRILAGRIESGRLRVGDKIIFSPSNKTAHVKSIEAWSVPDQPMAAHAGQSVGITLDEQLFIERGEVISHEENPPVETDVFRATVFWLGRKPITVGSTYKLKINTHEAQVTVQSIDRVIDTGDLSTKNAVAVERNEVAEITLRSRHLMAVDEFNDNPRTGRFVLVDDFQIAGGGIVSMEGYADQRELVTVRSTNVYRVEHAITKELRERRNGHKGGVLWFTGLSGSGKSTLALEVERQLFSRGLQVYVLDGDNVRHGLNADLGFSPEDRAENIRRIGEVAALMSRAGFITLTAFISPYRSDRERARKSADGMFHEVYVKADLETCESRDPKGLYKKAREGQIPNFTGISAPYEAPENPELEINTSEMAVEECVDEIVSYVMEHFSLDD